MRRELVGAIKTPIAFFTLVTLVTELTFTTLVLAVSGTDRTFLLYAMVGILVLLVLLVAALAIFQPGALWDRRQASEKKASRPKSKKPPLAHVKT